MFWLARFIKMYAMPLPMRKEIRFDFANRAGVYDFLRQDLAMQLQMGVECCTTSHLVGIKRFLEMIRPPYHPLVADAIAEKVGAVVQDDGFKNWKLNFLDLSKLRDFGVCSTCALNAQMRAEILHAVRHSTEVARVLVMTGAGIAFCSGQDLNDSGVVGKIDLERSLRDQYNPMLQAITDSPIPTISAVNGPAAGAGANLALAADVVIAADNAYFAQAFTRIGLMPDAGGTYTLPRRMGMAKAMGAALFAEKISAQQADRGVHAGVRRD